MKNTNYFYAIRISISLAVLSEVFIKIGYFFYELCNKTEVDVFCEHSVYVYLMLITDKQFNLCCFRALA